MHLYRMAYSLPFFERKVTIKGCVTLFVKSFRTLQRRHNENDGVSNHRRLACLLKVLLRRRSKKTSSSTSLAFMRGIHRSPVNSPHKGPVTRKMFPFDDVIMGTSNNQILYLSILDLDPDCMSVIFLYIYSLSIQPSSARWEHRIMLLTHICACLFRYHYSVENVYNFVVL